MARYNNNLKAITVAAFAGMNLVFFPAPAANAADLQENLIVADTVIRLADIFTDTGAQGEEIIMAAPAPGKKVQLSSYELVRIAEKFELDWQRPAYLKRIYFHRESTAFSLNDLKPIILAQTNEHGVTGDIEIKIFGRKNGLHMPVGYSLDDITVGSFSLSDQQNRYSAVLQIPTGTNEPSEIRISGTIDEVRLVPMFNRVIAPGEVIAKADIKWTKYPVKKINRNAITDITQLVGQTVKRALPAGKILNQNDIMMPVAIAKGSTVQMTYRAGALTLSMQGRALEDGGTGDTIRIMNPKSKKIVFAVVIRDGYAEVASLTPVTIASR